MTRSGKQQQTVLIHTNRYLIYIPNGTEASQALSECLTYAEREHPEWTSAGVVVGRWQAVISMLLKGEAEMVLIARRSHLPPDRIPRVVSVEEELAGPVPRDSRRPGGRRPRLS